MKRFDIHLVESKISDIKKLQPNTVLSLFHGSTEENIYNFCVNGVDAKKSVHRLYPHQVGGKRVTRGLYVTPDIETAFHFGQVVIKFKAMGKDLYPMYGQRTKLKGDDMMKKKYPDSFRPEVSYDMLERGKGQESQALFLGFISPRQIEKVYIIDGSKKFNRKEYIEYIDSKRKINIDDSIIEPQDIDISVDDAVDAIYQYHNRRYNKDKIKYLLVQNAKSGEDIGHGMGFRLPYTVNKRLTKKLKKITL